jgi:hypothetical protein
MAEVHYKMAVTQAEAMAKDVRATYARIGQAALHHSRWGNGPLRVPRVLKLPLIHPSNT